jgi:hypothetical protein
MSEIVIQDNFLLEKDFKDIQDKMMSPYFPWFFNDYVVFEKEEHLKDNFQFTHTFVLDNKKRSNLFDLITPIINKITPNNLLRVKANLGTRNEKHIEHDFHTDFDEPDFTTAIFYINSNNGYTKFKDGEKVESVANRFVTFHGSKLHTGASQTDTKSRIVINFNYR